MPTDRLAELVARLEPVAKIGGLLKWLLGAIVVATAWLVTLQLTTASNSTAIAEIRQDRKERIQAAEIRWREKDKEDATRQATLDIAVKTQQHQQEQLDALNARPH